MGDNRLLTLKEIARELGGNYRTLLGCKHMFSKYMLGTPDGRNVKYSPEYKDFFQLVFALFDEGYMSNKIHNMLEYGVNSDEDMFVADWIDEWRERLGMKSNSSSNFKEIWSFRQGDVGMSGCRDGRIDGCLDGGIDRWRDGGTDGRPDGWTD